MLNREQFLIRRAVERLRDGLFDPVAVNRLTVEEKWIQSSFSKGLKALEKDQSEHLCICGSYGQGKSHTILYMSQQALREGYATSVVQLDFREVPFHQFPIVYQAILEKLSLPDGQTFAKAWKQCANMELLEGFDAMPNRFRMILTAMLGKNKQLTPRERTFKKYRDYQPKEYGSWLEQALMGHNIPISNLKKALKYREVDGYQKQSLICRGNTPYMQMVQSLGQLFKKMGYKGLVLFFDEGESIAQGRLGNRAKSYALLDQFFHSTSSVYPIFAFTEDFFDKVNHEPYNDERAIFPKNYAQAWRDINLVRLDDFSSQRWEALLDRLIQLYAQAYQVELPSHTKGKLHTLLQNIEGQETRFRLKSLVNQLDMESQQTLLERGTVYG